MANQNRQKETGYCERCGKDKPNDEFDEGKKGCKNCLEYKREFYYKNKDRYNEKERQRYNEDDDYRKQKRERTKEWKKTIITCPVCNISISQGHRTTHEKSKKHMNNLSGKTE